MMPAKQVDLITCLGQSFQIDGKSHYGSSKIMILYHLYQYSKRHPNIFPKLETIAKELGIHPETVRRFVNHISFKEFGEKIWRPFTSNLYRLKGWVIECFMALEKLGFMKHFRSDFKRWRKLWIFRMREFYVNKLIDKLTWSEVFDSLRFKTKLSTKQKDRCCTEDLDRCCTTRTYGIYEGNIKTDTGQLRFSESKTLDQSLSYLQSRFSIREGDLHWIANHVPLSDIKAGIRMRESLKRFYPESPIKGFMYALGLYKKEKKENGYSFKRK